MKLRVAICLTLAVFSCASCGRKSVRVLDTPLTSFGQEITSPIDRLRLRPGQTIQLPVVLTNTGQEPLISAGILPVTVSYIWFSGGAPDNSNSARTSLPVPLRPGERTPLDLRVIAPFHGTNLSLEVTVVQEGVAWFVDRGTKGLRIPVDLSEDEESGARLSSLTSDSKLSGFAQNIATTVKTLNLATGQTTKIPVTLSNPGPDPWSSAGALPITLSYRWYLGVEDKVPVTARTLLPQPLLPGQSVSLEETIIAPSTAGRYTLRLSMVQEGVQWFISAGGRATDIPVEAH